MPKIGKISVIRKEVSNSPFRTLDTELRKNGMSRTPGTGITVLPYREASGKYRTGLDPDADYIKRLSPEEQKIEKDFIHQERQRLEEELAVDLSPRSDFWNFAKPGEVKVTPYKLIDADNFFDLSIPIQAITYYWLKVHPRVASSHAAWEKGHYPADTQFYVADEEVENRLLFAKKNAINKAIVRLEQMTPERRKKVARQLGLPVTDNTVESGVYNAIDSLLKEIEFKDGQYRGLSTVEMFMRFADMKDDLLNIKDLVDQALTHSIYREKDSGRIFEGKAEVAASREDLVEKIYKDETQEERLTLEKKLSLKKTAIK
jgi:hypothetical protein